MTESTSTTIRISTGPAWAAILAASIGCAALGALTVLTEVSPRASSLLTFVRSSGDLSGVTTVSLIVWLISWLILHLLLRTRTLKWTAWAILFLSLIFILAGLLGTFPPIADWFSGH